MYHHLNLAPPIQPPTLDQFSFSEHTYHQALELEAGEVFSPSGGPTSGEPKVADTFLRAVRPASSAFSSGTTVRHLDHLDCHATGVQTIKPPQILAFSTFYLQEPSPYSVSFILGIHRGA